jgi:hypothetical protein
MLDLIGDEEVILGVGDNPQGSSEDVITVIQMGCWNHESPANEQLPSRLASHSQKALIYMPVGLII